MSLASTSIQHLECLKTLLEDLAPQDIALQSHEYDALGFGSFALVLGTSRRRVRFTWDGKEAILTIEYQEVQNQAGASAWEHDAYISVSPKDAIFAEIGSNAVSMLT